MQEFTGVEHRAPYGRRIEGLLNAGIGLWDVLHSSIRPGSLDADIDSASAVPNNLPGFLAAHTGVRRIGFNGRKAAQLFRKQVLPVAYDQLESLTLFDLPSTSPAHAAMSFENKLAEWSQLITAQESG